MTSPPTKLSRRRVLQGMGGALAAGACGGSDAISAGSGGGAAGAGGEPGAGGAAGSSSASTTGAGGSPPNLCATGDGGLSPQELLAPIDTIVVLMMENRSFDHYLGGSLHLLEGRADIVGLTGSESNPREAGGEVSVFAMSNTTPEDPPHSWDACHAQWNLGANDGFVIAHAGPHEHEVMGYYDRTQIPILLALADAYAVGNHYHCSVLSATWINRFYLHGATSLGFQDNTPLTGFVPIWDSLKDAGLTVKNYHHGVAWAMGGYQKLDDLGSFDDFKADAAAGTLPNFSIIDPQFFGGFANDDHPSNAAPMAAQLLISDVYTTLAKSPQWDRCLLIVNYDEHGGFYDHAPPPAATDDYPAFDRLGFRVPALVVGPYVRPGCGVYATLEHVSVLATLRTRWNIPNLNIRMASTADLSSCIHADFVKNRTPQPPVRMPELTMSSAALEAAGRVGMTQHPELLDSLRQHGIYRTVMKRFDPHRTFTRHFEHCRRRGLVRLV